MSRGREKKGFLRSFPDNYVIKIRKRSDDNGSISIPNPSFKRLSSTFTDRIKSMTISHSSEGSLIDTLTITSIAAEEPVTIEERMLGAVKKGTSKYLSPIATLFQLRHVIPEKGDALQISFGYNPLPISPYSIFTPHMGLIKIGIFYVNEINYSNELVIINANSCLDDHWAKNQCIRTWETPPNSYAKTETDISYTYKEVINEISKKLKLQGLAYIDEDLGDRFIEKRIQKDQSYLDFLETVTKGNSGICKIKNDKIYFVKKWEMPINDKSFNAPSTSTDSLVKAPSTIIQLFKSDFINYEFKELSRSGYCTVEAYWRNSEIGEADSSVFYSRNKPKESTNRSLQWSSLYKLPHIYISQKEALFAARKKLNEFIVDQEKFTGQILLEPQLVVGCQIMLKNFIKIRGGKLIDKLNVTSVTHTFSDNGFVTNFEATIPHDIRYYYSLGSKVRKEKTISEEEEKKQQSRSIKYPD